MKYRTERLWGEGYRDAVEVIAHEMFELENPDIPDTLSETILKDTPLGKDLQRLSQMLCGEIRDVELEKFFDNARVHTSVAQEYARKIVDAINEKTGKNIRYVLWLCDNPEDITEEYDFNDELQGMFYDAYEESDVIISDIGSAGYLYGYEEDPQPVDFGDDEEIEEE